MKIINIFLVNGVHQFIIMWVTCDKLYWFSPVLGTHFFVVYLFSWILWIKLRIQQICFTIFIYIDYNRGRTNVQIHENIFFQAHLGVGLSAICWYSFSFGLPNAMAARARNSLSVMFRFQPQFLWNEERIYCIYTEILSVTKLGLESKHNW
jgi:hypothetical protein